MTVGTTLVCVVAYFGFLFLVGVVAGKFLSLSSDTEPTRDRDGYIVRD